MLVARSDSACHSAMSSVWCLCGRPPHPEMWFLGSSGTFKQLLVQKKKSKFIFYVKFVLPKIFLMSCGCSKARHNAAKHSSFFTAKLSVVSWMPKRNPKCNLQEPQFRIMRTWLYKCVPLNLRLHNPGSPGVNLKSCDEYVYCIPNPKHTLKYTKLKVLYRPIQDKHTQLSSFAWLHCFP